MRFVFCSNQKHEKRETKFLKILLNELELKKIRSFYTHFYW